MRAERVEILVEEPSMEAFLTGLLPRVLPEGFELSKNCFIRPHQGKSDLRKRLPNNVRAYRNYPQKVILIVVHDQDSNDCVKLKSELLKIISDHSPDLQHLVRIACRELENWYLGDLIAVERIYPNTKASKNRNKAKFRDPDQLNGSEEMERFTKEFTKMNGARRIGLLINVEENKSLSFRHFIQGVNKLLTK